MQTISRRSLVAVLGAALLLGACAGDMQQPLAPEDASLKKSAPPPPASLSLDDELYLIDNICPDLRTDGSCVAFNNGSELYEVELSGGNAVTTHLFSLQGNCAANNLAINCTIAFDQGHIGTTPDGRRIWVVQRRQVAGGGNPVGFYDLDAGEFFYQGEITGIGDGVVLAAFSPFDELYVANQDNNTLYRVDTGSLNVTASWNIRINNAGGPILDLVGADLAFDAGGQLYVYTNASSAARRGLYRVTIEGGNAIANRVANHGTFFTGLAFRGAGNGNLVMSQVGTQIIEVNPNTGAQVASYTLAGDLTVHRFGDMATGRLALPAAVPMFVIGDEAEHDLGELVNFWGAQWWKNNPMSGRVSPGVASFKGFAVQSDNVCGGTWMSRPGNSSKPPKTIPDRIAIIVTNSVVKQGPRISGNIQKILIVDARPGYGPAPGHRGFGVVTEIVCP